MMKDLKLIYRRSLSIHYLLFVVIIIACLSRILQRQAKAKVTGECVNCHTMHNSQDGTAVDPNGPNQYLLSKYCVGCHSATDGSTWKDPITGAPIVYNTAEPSYNTQKGLAAGNFYYVAQDQSKGHNVTDIPGVSKDDNFPPTPGRWDDDEDNTKNCGECHDQGPSLLVGRTYQNVYYSGCEFCHGIYGSHHADDTIIDGLTQGTSYRFLKTYVHWGHSAITGVKGIEDNDWEKTVDPNDHNEYCGKDGITESKHSISRYCGHCHGKFHGAEDTGSVSPWIRHPSENDLPSGDTEYAEYTIYNPEAPIARDPAILATMNGPSREVTSDDQVSCISCHRVHGSPYADILRWNYSTMKVGGTTTGGCFTCHTTKNGL